MFPWRKRNDGFEWREYVRTTILVRRGDRRRRVEEAKDVAFGELKNAGRWSASKAGSGTQAVWALIISALLWLIAIPGRLLLAVRPFAGPFASRLAARGSDIAGVTLDALDPLLSFLRRREIKLPLLLFAAIGAIGAVVRYVQHGFDNEVTYAAAIAGVSSLLIALPAYAHGARLHLVRRVRSGLQHAGFAAQRIPGIDRLAPRPVGAFAVAAVALIAGGAWYANTYMPVSPTMPRLAAQTGPNELEGRASAVSGDSLRVNGQVVRLAGIEAPEREQLCQRPKTGNWRCGDAAKSVLERMTRGRRVTCTRVASSSSEPALVECTIEGDDVAAGMVRGGHAFAQHSGPHTRYASLESQAQNANVGVWFGSAERPAEYRAKKWEEAKRNAPEGCPIKGQVTGRAKVYVLPWSPSYDNVRVRETRGDRWFCSEDEARAAGWKATAKS